ncbi:MAG: methyltransferase domain-containing protein [Acidimicrobiia bacterium]|jgi:hypothetical protein
MQQQRRLQDAWLSTLSDLGAADGVDTLLIGPYAESLADQLPAPTGDTTPNVATLRVTPVPGGAIPTATGFPGGSFDSAVALSAWETPADVFAVVEEAVRVVRPGGSVWLGEVDARALTLSMPAARRYGLLYREEPEVATRSRFRLRAADGLGVEAVRAGLREVVGMRADLPVAVVDSAAEGVEAVRSGIWPESAVLDAAAFDRLLSRVNDSLQPPTRFPVVFTLPFSIVRGLRP